MPIINSYPQDIDIQDKDAWIGTDYATRGTKQYTADAVANYLNKKGKVSIAGQLTYKFVDTLFAGVGTMALNPDNGTSFSAITGFKISKDNLSGKAVVAYLQFLTEQDILIADQDDPEKFGHYKVTSYTVDPTNDQYYNLVVSFLGGNGSIVIDNVYDIVNFSLSSGDKNFVFTQAVASATWNVQHNLNKFPSCTMVLSTGQQGYGDVTFIDENNLTITFASAESGKAYIN